jgi:hypothetical protein
MYNMDKERGELLTGLKELTERVNNKVTFKTFTWVMGAVFGILTTLLGYVVNRVDTINYSTSATSNKVATIEGILQRAEFIK